MAEEIRGVTWDLQGRQLEPWEAAQKLYVPGDWGTLPERRGFYATHLGWHDTQPILGLYNGYTLEDYPTRHKFRNWSIWDAGAI